MMGRFLIELDASFTCFKRFQDVGKLKERDLPTPCIYTYPHFVCVINSLLTHFLIHRVIHLLLTYLLAYLFTYLLTYCVYCNTLTYFIFYTATTGI